jgi:hypothetical protein
METRGLHYRGVRVEVLAASFLNVFDDRARRLTYRFFSVALVVLRQAGG